MKKSIGLVVIVAGLALFAAQAVQAKSCTDQAKECDSWASGPNSSYKPACKKEIGACIARCKQGQKYFLGVAVGNQYPIDTCK